MNVLLILGNGFDLNMALPTSYSHFYDYYLYEEDDKLTDACRLLKDSLQHWKFASDPNMKAIIDWSDLELALGELTTQYTSKDDFLEVTEHIENRLAHYLNKVDNLPIKDLQAKARVFIEDVVKVTLLTELENYVNEKRDKDGQVAQYYFDNLYFKKMKNFVGSYANHRVLNIDIMSFNYTHTVERILEEARKNGLLSEKVRVNNLYHIHQELSELGIVIGVNDLKQVKNESFRYDSELNKLFVKPNLTAEFASDIDQNCIQAIEKADVILLFGLSLGKTDSVWWSHIGSMTANKNKRIVYCPYETSFDYTSKRIVSKNGKLIQNVFGIFKELGITDSSLLDKICPIRMNQLFHFESPESIKKRLQENHNLILDVLLPSDRAF